MNDKVSNQWAKSEGSMVKLCLRLLDSRDLWHSCVMIVAAATPLLRSYLSLCKMKTHQAHIEHQIDHATGSSSVRDLQCLMQMTKDHKLLGLLSLSAPLIDEHGFVRAEQLERTETLFKLVISTASERAWALRQKSRSGKQHAMKMMDLCDTYM